MRIYFYFRIIEGLDISNYDYKVNIGKNKV